MSKRTFKPHRAECQCPLCQEYRELQAVFKAATVRRWYINPVVILRIDALKQQIGSVQ